MSVRDDNGGDLLSPVWRHPRRIPTLGLRDWEQLLGQARQSRTLARLAQLCLDLDAVDTVPPAAWRHLRGAVHWVDRQAHEVMWEVDCVHRALIHEDTPIVLLKGGAYLAAGLPAAKGRLFNDIDIMVDPSKLVAVESSLLSAGWMSAEPDPYNQRYYREWRHELPPLRHITRDSFLDVHHTITAPTSHFAVDGARLLDKVRPIGKGGRLFILQPVDMVLHSAVHLFQEGEFDHGLRDLLDLDALLLHFERVEPGFWNDLFDRANDLNLRVPLYHALHHVQRLFGTAPPSALAERVRSLQPNALARHTMGWLLVRALRPMHPSCDLPLTGLARALLFLRAQWLRMPLRLLVPHLVRKAWMRVFPPENPNPTITA